RGFGITAEILCKDATRLSKAEELTVDRFCKTKPIRRKAQKTKPLSGHARHARRTHRGSKKRTHRDRDHQIVATPPRPLPKAAALSSYPNPGASPSSILPPLGRGSSVSTHVVVPPLYMSTYSANGVTSGPLVLRKW